LLLVSLYFAGGWVLAGLVAAGAEGLDSPPLGLVVVPPGFGAGGATPDCAL